MADMCQGLRHMVDTCGWVQNTVMWLIPVSGSETLKGLIPVSGSETLIWLITVSGSKTL